VLAPDKKAQDAIKKASAEAARKADATDSTPLTNDTQPEAVPDAPLAGDTDSHDDATEATVDLVELAHETSGDE
jgi:hypothetical protein